MSVASEISRIQSAKSDLKASINAKTDNEHQITDETIDEYADFVDSITSGGGFDWSAIGYSNTPQTIENAYNYAKEIYDNWDSTQTTSYAKFQDDKNLVIMPLVDTSNSNNTAAMFYGAISLLEIPLLDTSNVTTFYTMFQGCYSLRKIPVLNTSKVTFFDNCYRDCRSLSDNSLDNILQMCIGSTSYTGTKTLKQIGITSSYYTSSRIQALPHYQDFINAGWTIGY